MACAGVAMRFWSPKSAPVGRTPGDDQFAFGLGKCADDSSLLRAGNHPVRSGVKGLARALCHQIGNISGLD